MKTEISHNVWQFSRSKNRHSVLFYFYRYALLTFVGFMVVVLLIEVISDGWEALIGLFYDRFMRIALPAAAIYTLFVFWVGKGSLVESVVIDYPQREIRVTHYRLPSALCERKLSFDGFRWDVLNGGKGWDRLRLKPKEGKRVVICMMHLGWKLDDCWELMEALSVITPKDKR
ncbi:MAG: hypothetical protein IKH97_00060 [Bacteroidales bacterium]|nr:hypothetical protein [Bacteroidales bacterium]